MSKFIAKIKNYNQILLALAGTIGIIFLIFVCIVGAMELIRSNTDDHVNHGVLTIEETAVLQQDSLRKQIISFNSIQMIDSINQRYLIPVTQADLDQSEKIDENLGLMRTNSRSKEYSRYYGNTFCNLVIFDNTNLQSKILFDHRISIKDFIIHQDNSKQYIIIPACDEDSNEDGYLNEKDLQKLFIYNDHAASLHEIKTKENYTLLKAYQPSKSRDLVAHFGVDRNNDGFFDSSSEPKVFYKVNLNNMRIEHFINDAELAKLQLILEGN